MKPTRKWMTTEDPVPLPAIEDVEPFIIESETRKYYITGKVEVKTTRYYGYYACEQCNKPADNYLEAYGKLFCSKKCFLEYIKKIGFEEDDE